MKSSPYRIVAAFLTGALAALVLAILWTARIRRENALLKQDMRWAVQRCVVNEAMLILCRERLTP